MDQTTMRDAPCLEASQAFHASVIAPAGAAAVQQTAPAAQAAAAAGIACQACGYGGTTPMPPGDSNGMPDGIG